MPFIKRFPVKKISPVFLFPLFFLFSCEEVEKIWIDEFFSSKKSPHQAQQDDSYQFLMKQTSAPSAESISHLSLVNGDSPETGIPALIHILYQSPDQDTVLQQEIVAALANCGHELTIAPLCHYLLKTGIRNGETSSENSLSVRARAVRSEAANGLGLSGNKFAIPALIEALQDSELVVRTSAVKALQRICNLELNYSPQDHFEKRIIGQNQWLNWWNEHSRENRENFLIEGFKSKGIPLEDLDSPESLRELALSTDRGEEFIAYNALDILLHLTIKDSEKLNNVNEILLPLLDHEQETVRSSTLRTLIHLNGLDKAQLNEKSGQMNFSKSISYSPGNNLEAAIAFVKDWWQNRSK
jgi:HEAT repeat protein